MSPVRSSEPPADALTLPYRAAGEYVDCYVTELARAVSFSQFVSAFYTTPLFRLERWILRRLVAKPSTDEESRDLADGKRNSFAAWRVEARAPNQLLLRDFTGRTYSWLMVAAATEPSRTRLYFGSVVTRVRDARTGRIGLGPVHGRLLGFHKLYSRLLLGTAASRLARERRNE
ncbi:MAG: hypothetical protein ACREVI_16385 [Steroidobacteraceae bacterium]